MVFVTSCSKLGTSISRFTAGSKLHFRVDCLAFEAEKAYAEVNKATDDRMTASILMSAVNANLKVSIITKHFAL